MMRTFELTLPIRFEEPASLGIGALHYVRLGRRLHASRSYACFQFSPTPMPASEAANIAALRAGL